MKSLKFVEGMNSLKAIVVCGGSIYNYKYLKKYFDDAGFVIAADSGAHHLRMFNIVPDALIGDFDSIAEEDFEFFTKTEAEILRFPSEKDMTDTELALKTAMDKGCKELILIGATGTRLDHTLANVFLLKRLLASGIKAVLADEHNEIELIDKSIEIKKEEGMKVSLLPVFGNASGVTTKGLYYPLINATLESGTTWGVSNEFVENIASVTIVGGYLLVIKAWD